MGNSEEIDRQVAEFHARPLPELTSRRAVMPSVSSKGMRSATMVTLREEESILEGGRTIRIVPAWRWFLEPS